MASLSGHRVDTPWLLLALGLPTQGAVVITVWLPRVCPLPPAPTFDPRASGWVRPLLYGLALFCFKHCAAAFAESGG